MAEPLLVAFLWHMHQPYYRDLVTGECSMPWVRLHATKDYLDMVKRLEPFPSLHQTVNVVPSLVDQLQEYLPPANRTDRFLDLSLKAAGDLSLDEQRFVLRWFFLANFERMIQPSPRYHDLLAKRGLEVREDEWPAVQRRFSPQDYRDLQVWFNLAWMDPWLRRQDPALAQLEAKGSHFTEEEKAIVLTHQLTVISRIIPEYRAAVARGQLELSSSPYYHPIVPLLCDSRSARVALPQLSLPETAFRHADDARWQLHDGLRRHQEVFGARPEGLWPPEGSVSEELVSLALEAGVRWMATDEELLWRTVKMSPTPSALYRPHLIRRAGGTLAVIFRDRQLSDLVGFVYSRWDPKIAAADFIKRLEGIHRQCQGLGHPGMVSIILDGENAWESYPDDGHPFLATLYQALAGHPDLRCLTVSECLTRIPWQSTPSLPPLFSGSWIDANFATWIGHPEKNVAWKHLASARETFDSLPKDRPEFQQAWRSLGAAEGSDWMWWFGDTHYSAQADEFDRLFRTHLANSYRLAHRDVPEALAHPIRQVLPPYQKPTGLIQPVIDGLETSYYEWLYAGKLDLRRQDTALHRSDQYLHWFFWGLGREHLYLRLDGQFGLLNASRPWRLVITMAPRMVVWVCQDAAGTLQAEEPGVSCALKRVLELAVPHDLLDLEPGAPLRLSLSLLHDEQVLERIPAQGGVIPLEVAWDVDTNAWPL